MRIQSKLADGSNGDTRIQFGGNRLAPDDSREVELQLIDHAYLQRGDVLYTVGTDNTLTRLSTYIAESQSGLFEFNSLADLDDAASRLGTAERCRLTDPQPTTHQSVLELGLFAQAEWRPTPRMTTTLGLRWDGSAFLTAPPRNALVEQVLGERTDRAPKDWTKIEPRAQIVWDVDGTGRDYIRVGGGRFAAQPIYYLQHDQLLNDGSAHRRHHHDRRRGADPELCGLPRKSVDDSRAACRGRGARAVRESGGPGLPNAERVEGKRVVSPSRR